MTDFIDEINIENFKSLRSCQINGCKRINLFIGRPNVGKSNILEALSLFSIPFLRETSNKKLSSLIRLQNEPELFYNGETERELAIRTNIGSCRMSYHHKEGLRASIDFFAESFEGIKIDEKLNVSGIRNSFFETPVKRYNFTTNVNYKKGHSKYLIPPLGSNLLSVIENYTELREDIRNLFSEYGLKIALDKASQTIKVIQPQKTDELFLIPYTSIADTLQRIIFYKAAIASNENSVLLFEEPEAHSYPPYMTHLTQEMIHKKSNQFFVATHSSFVLTDLLENGMDDLAVFVVSYENYQSRIKRLTDLELHEVMQNGMDLFTNVESFT